MFANNFIKHTLSKIIITCAALLIAVFATLAAHQSANAQDKGRHGEMKNPTPDGKDCYRYEGKRYCLVKEEGGASGKLKAADKPQALKDCWWYNKRLYCIKY